MLNSPGFVTVILRFKIGSFGPKTPLSGFVSIWYRREVDINSPGFRRTFPKIVLGVCGLGLFLVLVASVLTAIGYNQ
jgi:hypothetical protein